MQPSPCASILPPPVVRSRSRSWHRPVPRSVRNNAHPQTSDARCHRCAASSRQCPPRPTLAVRSRLLTPLDQSCCLQRCLHPAVTQPDAVQLAQLLVKVLYVEVEVLLPVELQHLLHRLHRHSLGTGTALPVIPQPAVTVLVKSLAPAPHPAVLPRHNLGRFPPLQLPRSRLQNDFLCLHHPLHLGGRNLLLAHIHSSQLFLATLYKADISPAN